MRSFLHLSDIHFRKTSGGPFDVDVDLRNQLINDVKVFVADHDSPDAILVSGDVAFSGDESEYQTAKEWLEEICTVVGRDLSIVWCVPGNHDVDQRRVKESSLLAELQAGLRSAGARGIDEKLEKHMGDSRARDMLFESIEEYNRFARIFACEIGPDNPTWRSDFVLDDGSALCVNGMNTAMVSNHLDNTVKTVVLGRYQIPQEREGVVNLMLCHHPPDWWSDDEQLGHDLRKRCAIQLFGHKHTHHLERIDDTIVVSSGAVHPERQEDGWEPRYNWLHVELAGVNVNRTLRVTVFPRVWHDAKFIADSNSCSGQDHNTYSIELVDWTAPAQAAVPSKTDVEEQDQPAGEASEEVVNRGRVLTYRFFELPHVVRLAIAQGLELIRDEDEGLSDTELFHRVLTRARDADLLADLWRIVQEKHGDDLYKENPYNTDG